MRKPNITLKLRKPFINGAGATSISDGTFVVVVLEVLVITVVSWPKQRCDAKLWYTSVMPENPYAWESLLPNSIMRLH